MGFNMTEIVEGRTWKKFMAKLYGWGAAVVIVGALFKIMHWPGAGPMLVCGLGTEAVIFFFSAFEPIHEDIDWSLVYPELAGIHVEEEIDEKHPPKKSALEKFDDMINNAEIGPELFQKLGTGLKSLNETTEKLSDISEASVATNQYITNVKSASGSLESFSSTYDKNVEALNENTLILSNSYSKTAQLVSTSGGILSDKIAHSADNLSDVIGKSVTGLSDAINASGTILSNKIAHSGDNMTEVVNKSVSGLSESISVAVNIFTDKVANSGNDIDGKVNKSIDNLSETIVKSGKEFAAHLNETGYEIVKKVDASTAELSETISTSGHQLALSYKKLADTLNNDSSAMVDKNRTYAEQLEIMNKNLSALNAVYELQLHGTNEHLQASEKLYSGLEEMMNNLKESVDDTMLYKQEVHKLSQNLAALNTIYGNMLTAMTFNPRANG